MKLRILLLLLLVIPVNTYAVDCNKLLVRWANTVNNANNKAAGKPILKQIYKHCINKTTKK